MKDEQRQQDALGPMLDQSAQVRAAGTSSCREKTADQKEELQPEAVYGV